MSYSVGKVIRDIYSKGNNSIYFLFGDDYFLLKMFITKLKNIEICKKNKNFSLIQKEIQKIDLIPIFKKVDYLFHMAAQPGVRTSWGKGFENYSINNILVTQKLLEQAKISNSYCLIFIRLWKPKL